MLSKTDDLLAGSGFDCVLWRPNPVVPHTALYSGERIRRCHIQKFQDAS